jgi:hypothetical protein
MREMAAFEPGGKGVVVPGCVAYRKLLYTSNQYLSHQALDVLPQIIDRVMYNCRVDASASIFANSIAALLFVCGL